MFFQNTHFFKKTSFSKNTLFHYELFPIISEDIFVNFFLLHSIFSRFSPWSALLSSTFSKKQFFKKHTFSLRALSDDFRRYLREFLSTTFNILKVFTLECTFVLHLEPYIKTISKQLKNMVSFIYKIFTSNPISSMSTNDPTNKVHV